MLSTTINGLAKDNEVSKSQKHFVGTLKWDVPLPCRGIQDGYLGSVWQDRCIGCILMLTGSCLQSWKQSFST